MSSNRNLDPAWSDFLALPDILAEAKATVEQMLAALPSTVLLITKTGRTFRRVGTRPHTRKDRSETTLAVWETTCSECGEPFIVETPARATASAAFALRRCPAHRKTTTPEN